MQDRRQIQLFEANAGKVAPSEEGLYLGTSGWSYADWEGTVYSPGTPPAGRLAEYARQHGVPVLRDAERHLRVPL